MFSAGALWGGLGLKPNCLNLFVHGKNTADSTGQRMENISFRVNVQSFNS